MFTTAYDVYHLKDCQLLLTTIVAAPCPFNMALCQHPGAENVTPWTESYVFCPNQVPPPKQDAGAEANMRSGIKPKCITPPWG